MKWICVRSYGNGKHMNSVFPMYFEWLSQAETQCKKLNEYDNDISNENRWIPIPLTEFKGEVWIKNSK